MLKNEYAACLAKYAVLHAFCTDPFLIEYRVHLIDFHLFCLINLKEMVQNKGKSDDLADTHLIDYCWFLGGFPFNYSVNQGKSD